MGSPPCSFMASLVLLARIFHESACCDRGYDCPYGRPQVSDPATYFSSMPQARFWISEFGFQIDDIAFKCSDSTTDFLRLFSGFSIRNLQSSTRWHSHLHGLATSICETSGLVLQKVYGFAWRVGVNFYSSFTTWTVSSAVTSA